MHFTPGEVTNTPVMWQLYSPTSEGLPKVTHDADCLASLLALRSKIRVASASNEAKQSTAKQLWQTFGRPSDVDKKN